MNSSHLHLPAFSTISALLSQRARTTISYPFLRHNPWNLHTITWNNHRPPDLFDVQWLIYQLGSVQSLSRIWLFATPWTAARQASLSITNSQSVLKLMSIESVMPSNHLILCHPLILLPSIFPSIRVFSNESALCSKWPKYNFSYTLFSYFMWKKKIQFLLVCLVSKSKYRGFFYFYTVLFFNAEFGE